MVYWCATTQLHTHSTHSTCLLTVPIRALFLLLCANQPPPLLFNPPLSSPQLGPALEAKDAPRARVICMADQLGVCHAPTAVARAYLAEHGFGYVRVLIHETCAGEEDGKDGKEGGGGQLRLLTAEALMPGLPTISNIGGRSHSNSDI